VVGFDLVLTIDVLNPENATVTHRIEYKDNLNDMDWIPDTNAIIVPSDPPSNVFKAFMVAPDATRFYRVVYDP
jgi:hypothetical protein